jgi:hypothetical protein
MTADRLPFVSDKEKPAQRRGLVGIWGRTNEKGQTGLRPIPQRLSQVPLWIATHELQPGRVA